MKKVLLFLTLCGSWANAAYITPEINRSGKSLNDSALAVAWSERKVVGFLSEFEKKDFETGGQEVSDSTYILLAPYLTFHRDEISVEGALGYYDFERDRKSSADSESDGWIPQIFSAYRLNQNLALAAGFQRLSFESSTGNSSTEESTRILTLGANYKHQNFALGGALEFTKYEVEDINSGNRTTYPDLSSTSILIGAGYFESGENEGKSLELALKYRGKEKEEENGRSLSIGKRLNLLANGTYYTQQFEIDAELEFANGKNYTETSDNDELSLTLEGEYSVTSLLYLDSEFVLGTEEETSTTRITTEVTTVKALVGVGYRANKIDGNFLIGYGNQDIEVQNSSTNPKSDDGGLEFKFDIAYKY